MMIKIKELALINSSGKPGEILDKKMIIACKDKAIKLNKLQKPNKAPIDGEDFFNGEHLKVGDIL